MPAPVIGSHGERCPARVFLKAVGKGRKNKGLAVSYATRDTTRWHLGRHSKDRGQRAARVRCCPHSDEEEAQEEGVVEKEEVMEEEVEEERRK